MTAEQLFPIVNTMALVAWILMATLPGRRAVTHLVAGGLIPGLLAATYVALVASRWGGPGGFSTLSEVALLFSDPWLLLAGWVHYLAFDLLIGVWEVTDARTRGIPHLLVVPCLFVTFMFGPAGWLLYHAVRRARAAGSNATT